MSDGYDTRQSDFRQYNYSKEFLMNFIKEFEYEESRAHSIGSTCDPAADMFRELMLQYGDIRGYVESGYANGEMSTQEKIVLDALRGVRDRCVADDLEFLSRAGLR